MDFITHAIIGVIIAELALWESNIEVRNRGRFLGAALAAGPDLGGLPAQFAFSWASGDWPWVYDPAHWAGVEESLWLIPYWITHSLLLVFMVFLVFRKNGWRVWPLMAWASHGATDILSHTGAWSTWPLFPLPGQIEGVGDPWSWSPIWWLICIALAGCVWYATSVMTATWRTNALEQKRL
ncbi:MAG: hypothetical protein ACKVIR_04550 [Candidatus Poseidoniales archaeon]|jgi:hypothetical protein